MIINPNIVLLWFRRDLRLDDNPALIAALKAKTLIPVYIHAPNEEGEWQPGAASNWWLHHSLKALHQRLQQYGSRLIIYHGPSLETLTQLSAKYKANTIIWNRRYEPTVIQRDKQIKTALRQNGVQVESFNSHLINEPWSIATQLGKPYRVFTPYWKTCKNLAITAPLQTISQVPPLPVDIESSCSIDQLALLDSIDWHSKFYNTWQVGEIAAQLHLSKLVTDRVSDYSEHRDIPSSNRTSKLSPHLCFGEISPQRILDTIHIAINNNSLSETEAEPFTRQIYWREFAYHLLYHFPKTTNIPLNPKFERFAWQNDRISLAKWQSGNTGIPIVDAGMRELWQTGWMHNRVRMIVASLLTKNIGIHWLDGARWFWDTLLDADLANNSMGWQWVAGTGADAAPYFRIFNPVTQSKRFDSEAKYIKYWLPELSGVDAKYIFAPWECKTPDSAAKNYLDNGLHLDLKITRQAALNRYSQLQ